MKSRLVNECVAAVIFLGLSAGFSAALGPSGQAEKSTGKADATMTQILGRPTDHSITVSVLASKDLEAFFEYGVKPGTYTGKTGVTKSQSGKPSEVLLDHLKANTRYYYRMRYRQPGEAAYSAGTECSFHTQRAPGSTFAFGVQGDSHPERLNRMYHPDLYTRTMQNARKDGLDFYIALGDDFSIDPLYNRGRLNPEAVAQIYINQRRFLGLVGSSSPLFLVNGNHEQAAAYLLDGTPNSPPVLAGKARNLYYPQPAPDSFYTGDREPVEFVGLLHDYYAWTWGDALFVTIDPYWHSPVQIDAGLGGGQGGRGGPGGADQAGRERGGRKGASPGQGGRKQGGRQGGGDRGGRNRDWWGITMGDAQYQWLKKTLEQSKARYKFVFAHHVLGTGRGGVEVADLYEWGGKNRAGEWEFDKKRPGWELPVHQLMVKNGVTIFFQGHDHLFARQQRDGVVYQEAPNPADQGYSVYNRDAYRSGDILPNSGHLRVTVSPANVKVDYVRSYLPQDETPDRKNGEVAFSYTIGASDPASQSPWTMARLPDTGQTRHFTETFGADCDYTINPPSFKNNGDGTVTDQVTGLMWQQADGGEMTWERAGAYCKGLALGGHNDWRIPFAHELFSITNHNDGKPALYPAFSRSDAEYWWSADPRADDPSRVWVVNAGGGIGPHPKNQTTSAGGNRPYHTRCVRSSVKLDGLFNSYTDNGNGTVTDNHTGLIWQKAEAPELMTWEEALKYAEALSLGGRDDWRLPNIKELQSLNDEHRTGPSINTAYFSAASPLGYWSSTTLANHSTRAWTIDFNFGIGSYKEKTEKLRVRAVRGGIANAAGV
jgi:hypothetical protein